MSAADFKNQKEDLPVEDFEAKPVKRGGLAKVKVDRRAKNLRVFSLSSIVLFIAIVLVINLVFQNLLGSATTFDWTPTQSYSISDTTKTILTKLTDKIRIVALFDRASWSSVYSSFLNSYSVSNTGAQVGEVPILLDEYVKLSSGKLSVEYVNPVKVPGIIKELDPDGVLGLTDSSAGSYIFVDEASGKSKIVTLSEMYALTADSYGYSYTNSGLIAEQAVSGAIQYVSSKVTPVVYFVTGHDESDFQTDYVQFAKILKTNNFDTKTLDIRTVSKIPDDAAMVAFLDPILDISSTEGTLLKTYLHGGGRMLLFCGFNDSAYPEMNILLSEFNIEITRDRVRESDTGRRFAQDPYTFLAEVPTSPVASQAYQLILGSARRLIPVANTLTWLTTSPILQTSAGGISEANGDANSPSIEGTQILGLAAENKGWTTGSTKTAKVVVLGSSSLVSDAALTKLGSYSQYNQYFIYYAMEWLIDASANSLYIPAKPLPSYSLTAGNASSALIAEILVAALIPLGLLLAALLVFRRRRHL
jgi:hypothetical protein